MIGQRSNRKARPGHNALRAKPLLTLRNATFRLGDRLVFQNTSWTFRHGEQWAVLGPNGSGKSLFGDALRGRLPLVAGEMNYCFTGLEGFSAEECIGHVSFQERRSELHGTVVQSRWNSLESHASLSVAEFLSYEHVMQINPFEVRDDRRARSAFERRSHRAIHLLGVHPFLERGLLSLSNGETQKVHLARVLTLPLRLLVLDEPFTGLDAVSRSSFCALLEDVMRTDLRVILLTSRPEDLPRTITNYLYLDNCRVANGERPPGALPARKSHRVQRIQQRILAPSSPSPLDERVGEAPLVTLRNASVRYGSATILDRINWTIYPGESWALLGPNGSGKTTLLSLISGDNPQAYDNDITVFGQRRGGGESIWDLKKHIGWVSPELQLHFDDGVTCVEAVGSGFHETIGLFEPLSRAQRQAATEWLDRFDLGKSASTPLFELSAGHQRLVLLARALVKRPKLLILDEPCQGLDTEHRDAFIAMLDHIIRSGTETAIYVTHRPEEIPPSIQRVLALAIRHA